MLVCAGVPSHDVGGAPITDAAASVTARSAGIRNGGGWVPKAHACPRQTTACLLTPTVRSLDAGHSCTPTHLPFVLKCLYSQLFQCSYWFVCSQFCPLVSPVLLASSSCFYTLPLLPAAVSTTLVMGSVHFIVQFLGFVPRSSQAVDAALASNLVRWLRARKSVATAHPRIATDVVFAISHVSAAAQSDK